MNSSIQNSIIKGKKMNVQSKPQLGQIVACEKTNVYNYFALVITIYSIYFVRTFSDFRVPSVVFNINNINYKLISTMSSERINTQFYPHRLKSRKNKTLVYELFSHWFYT